MVNKRIPTFIGMALILVGALVGVMFLKQDTSFLPRAAPEYIPQKVKITNVADTGFTISWITQEPAIGFIKYGTSATSLTVTATDERDQLTGDSGQFRSNYITVKGLEPQTTYYFKLGSHGKQLYDNNGQSFSLTTAPAVASPPATDTAYGQVETSAQTPAEGAIVYLNLPDATPLSALVKQNGNWTVTLSAARTRDLTSYAAYDPQTSPLEILVQASLNDQASAQTLTGNDQPVPLITLGQTHNFAADTTVPPPAGGPDTAAPAGPEVTPAAGGESKFSLQPIVVTEPDEDLSIQTPSEGTQVTSSQPEIKGIAPPGANLTITIHSDQVYTDMVTADATGKWAWVPPGYLEPGPHTVAISYNDEKGLLHTINRTFVVQAAGDNSGPAYESTPSARPTATPGVTAAPTVRPTLPPPTGGPAITPAPTPMPQLPQAGNSYPGLWLILLGSGLIAGGFVLYRQSWV